MGWNPCPVVKWKYMWDMAKGKFDYCTIDDDLNILHSGNNCRNDGNAFDSLGKALNILRTITKLLFIRMKFTVIYHLPTVPMPEEQ